MPRTEVRNLSGRSLANKLTYIIENTDVAVFTSILPGYDLGKTCSKS